MKQNTMTTRFTKITLKLWTKLEEEKTRKKRLMLICNNKKKDIFKYETDVNQS